MDSASIWDIYAGAKKLLPLYDRMQNRSLRQECISVQSTKHDNKISKMHNSNTKDPLGNDNTYLNYTNNEDIVSLDLLTPLSSSPSNFPLYSHANSNSTSTLHNNNNTINANNGKNSSNSNRAGRNNSNETIITPTSMIESPNNDDANTTNNNSKKPEPGDNFKNYAFSNINDFHGDGDDDVLLNDVDLDIFKELQRISEAGDLDSNISLGTNINLNSNPISPSEDFNNSLNLENKYINNNTSHNNITNATNTNNNNTNGLRTDNNNTTNSINPLQITIKPLDIKIKSDTSVFMNNQNILSNKPLNSNSNSNTKFINNNFNTNTNTNTTNNTNTNTNTKKSVKLKTPKTFNIIETPSASLLGSTPPPNKLQTDARQARLISSSAPTKDDAKKLLTKCNNCCTTKTPLWRKDPNGNTLCNACGLFLKLHGTMRPLSLKTDVIKKRNSKRQSISAQGEGYKNISNFSSNSNLSSSISKNSLNSYVYYSQSVPNANNMNTFSNPQQFQSQYQLPLKSANGSSISSTPNTSSTMSSKATNSSMPVGQMNQQSQFQFQSPSQSRAKNVPILPKPAKEISLPNTPNSSSFTNGSLPTQPQDIPHFKRRKSKLGLSTSQNSQPSSPLTTVSFSPSSTTSHSPYNNFNNSPAINMTNLVTGSPANSSSFNGPRSLSRNNSISSASSYNLYQDINNKRGLSYSNINALSSFALSTNSNLTMGLNNFNLGNNNATANNANLNNSFASPISPASTSSPNSSFPSSTNISQRQQRSSNFSNLSAGMNAIKVSSNLNSANAKSGLSNCIVSMNDDNETISDNKISDNGINNNNDKNINMDDLDWLKFDI